MNTRNKFVIPYFFLLLICLAATVGFSMQANPSHSFQATSLIVGLNFWLCFVGLMHITCGAVSGLISARHYSLTLVTIAVGIASLAWCAKLLGAPIKSDLFVPDLMVSVIYAILLFLLGRKFIVPEDKMVVQGSQVFYPGERLTCWPIVGWGSIQILANHHPVMPHEMEFSAKDGMYRLRISPFIELDRMFAFSDTNAARPDGRELMRSIGELSAIIHNKVMNLAATKTIGEIIYTLSPLQYDEAPVWKIKLSWRAKVQVSAA